MDRRGKKIREKEHGKSGGKRYEKREKQKSLNDRPNELRIVSPSGRPVREFFLQLHPRNGRSFEQNGLALNESDGLESRRRSVINSARFAIDESAIKAERVARDGRKQISPSNGSIFKSPSWDPGDFEARELRSSLCKNVCGPLRGHLRPARRLITDGPGVNGSVKFRNKHFVTHIAPSFSRHFGEIRGK